MGYGLNLGWGGPMVDYIGFWAGPIKGCITNLVQGSYRGGELGLDQSLVLTQIIYEGGWALSLGSSPSFALMIKGEGF